MHNFKFFLLFLTFLCCSKGIAMAQNCNLPAPSGLTWTYPTQNTVKFTWNSVSGAWGYRITMNAQNTQGQGQTIQAPVTEATFTYVPNTTYDIELYCGCSATDYSTNKTTARITPDGLIIVVDINPGLTLDCDTYQLIWAQNHIDVNTTYISNQILKVGNLYKIEFNHDDKPVKSVLQHDLEDNANNNISHVTNVEIFPNSEWGLSGSEIITNNYYYRANLKKLYSAANMKVNVNYYRNVVFLAEGEGTFSDFKIYECLEGIKITDRNHKNKSPYAVSPNPFLDQISIFIKGHTQGMLTAKMLDAAGQLKWIQQYDSASLQNQAFVIQTQDMPAGMYFLQISDARGVLETHRLIKQ